MTVAVLGGGLQGCCIAIALADKGVPVVLFDRNDSLMSRAAVANEGKIHLGYMYAGDPSMRTAKAMLRGALSFAPFLSRHLGVDPARFDVSDPAVYVVHRNAQRSVEDIADYLKGVHALVNDYPAPKGSYFGIDLETPLRRWSNRELEDVLDPREILAAFSSPEVAIQPLVLAGLIRDRIAQTPLIEVRLGHEIDAVEGSTRPKVVSSCDGHTIIEAFDHAVNALWDGRIGIDTQRGDRPARAWIHRLKYGVDLGQCDGVDAIRSITIILGPFGEVVRYPTGSVYLTWYPSCLRERTHDVTPPDWVKEPQGALREEIIRGTLDALRAIQPALAVYGERAMRNAVVRGGAIVAWGETDIDDVNSELHRRFEIGVTSRDRYHSVDPGKLTAAPYFAEQCAERIAGPT